MSGRTYAIACLAGGGVGPELMGEASRVLRAVAELHELEIEERHVSFGDEALARLGHSLPDSTRSAYRDADALLTATRREPALAGVRADLELACELRRALFAPAGDVALLIPLAPELEAWTVAEGFALASRRRGRIASVAGDERRRACIERGAADSSLIVEHLSLESARLVLEHDPRQLDVLVADRRAGEALAAAATNVAASAAAELASGGPAIFGPTTGSAAGIAGQGVANPSGIFLATAMLLSEGLGERAAARTLERAIADALRRGARTADMVRAGVAATTREFTETVLSGLVRGRTDPELSMEAHA
ncbi:MAG: isocitrate/isopropylmalate family dehydrogenase [Gaiellaceae bacterium]